MIVKIVNKSKNSVVAQARVAASFGERLRGLMGQRRLEEESGLVFYRAGSIHTFFMRFPLDIIFLDKNKRVAKIYAYLKPNRVAVCSRSAVTLELVAGRARQTDLEVGDYLELTPCG